MNPGRNPRWERFGIQQLAVIHRALVIAPVGNLDPDLYQIHTQLLDELIQEFDRRNQPLANQKEH